jgi:hypothetical protein
MLDPRIEPEAEGIFTKYRIQIENYTIQMENYTIQMENIM